MFDRSKALIAAAFVLLAGLAAWGWLRKPAGPYANANSVQPVTAQPATYASSNGTYGNEPSNPPETAAAYTAAPEPWYASRDYVRTVRPNNNAPNTYAPAGYAPNGYAPNGYGPNGYVEQRERVVERPMSSRYVQRGSADRVYYPKDRSKKKSAMIVGGSAAGGAAIGALAGGGKGAGIGALTGGVGGFIYDRLTHKH